MKKMWIGIVGFFGLVILIVGGNHFYHFFPMGEPTEQKTEPVSNDVSSLNWKVPNFTYIDQNNKKFGLKDVSETVWIADFVFTRCPNVCPPMTANMVRLQKALKENGLKVPTVSFSVDPDYDTPKMLRQFAEEHGAQFTNWHFLTGYTQEEVKEMAKTSFKGIVEPQEEPSSDFPMLINHPTLFYLVKGDTILRYYDGLNLDSEQVIKAIKEVR